MILRKPSSLTQFWAYTFIILGPVFIIAGYLYKLGILAGSSDSKLNFTSSFITIGSIIFLLALVVLIIALYKENERKKLKTSGMKLEGVITKVDKLRYIKWGKASAHIIYYYYKRYGCRYEGKSFLIWDKPSFTEGEKIDIYINDSKRYDSFIEVKNI